MAILIPLLVAGCADVDGLDQMAIYLPAGTTLTNPVLDGPKKSPEITVRDKLKELGAHIGQDQKLYDRTRREIYFVYHGPGQGWARPHEERLHAEQERSNRLTELKKKFTVVTILSNGPDIVP